MTSEDDSNLKHYIDALMEGHKEATKVADESRNKSADLLIQTYAERTDKADKSLEQYIDGQVNLVKGLIEAYKLELDLKLRAERELRDQETLASKTALDKAEAATEKRFHAVNEFREQLSEQAVHLMPREVAESKIDELRSKVEESSQELTDLRAQQVGAGQRQASILALATFFIIVTIAIANYLAAH